MENYLNNTQEVKEYAPRFKRLYVVLAITGFVFLFRLWYLQIIKGQELRLFSERNSFKRNKIVAPRGIVYDRDGRVLIENLPGFEVTISPQYTDDLQETATAVSHLVDLPTKAIVNKVKKSRRNYGPFRPVPIKENLSREEVFRLKRIRIDHPGLDVKQVILRSYPLKESAAHLLGYVGEISRKQIPKMNRKYKDTFHFEQGDIIGKSGLEEVLDIKVRGKDGVSFLQVDARGRKTETYDALNPLHRRQTEAEDIIGSLYKPRPPEPGRNVILTIDKDIQQAAYQAFTLTDRIGSAVAIRPNGEVLAWVSSPSYDPNEFTSGLSNDLWSKLINDPFRPLRNKIIQDHNSPGSTFKPIVALAALQEKLIKENTKFFCPGYIRFGRRQYHCHLRYGHGEVNVLEAIEQSCNVFFYKLGISLGIDKIAQYAKAFGIGFRTGIELHGEVPGLVPTTDWKRKTIGEEWQPGENLSHAIGQGFLLTTPLQMAMSYAALGKEGPLYKPYLIKKILDKENRVIQEFEPQLVRDLSQEQKKFPKIDPSVFNIVKRGVRRVANGPRGTARWWKIPGVEIAGKTGTGQLMSFSADQVYQKCDSRPIEQRHHGWFVGYAPADNPHIVVAVLAEHSCAGSSGAAPVVRDIIWAFMKKYHPELLKVEKKRALAKNQSASSAQQPRGEDAANDNDSEGSVSDSEETPVPATEDREEQSNAASLPPSADPDPVENEQ